MSDGLLKCLSQGRSDKILSFAQKNYNLIQGQRVPEDLSCRQPVDDLMGQKVEPRKGEDDDGLQHDEEDHEDDVEAGDGVVTRRAGRDLEHFYQLKAKYKTALEEGIF